jgi:antitoxin MazE
MKTRIIRIGNSQGVRIPKRLLDQAGLRAEVEICVQDGSLVIKPAHRSGWAAAFQAMAELADDVLLDTSSPTCWDVMEWEWQ